jgi:phenylalanyl-tRNA synthetase alpha subunit
MPGSHDHRQMSLPTLNVRSFLDDNVSHIKPEYRRAFEERLTRFLAAWLGDFETSLRELEDDHEKLLAAARNENRARAEEERGVITKLRESLEVLRVEERDARTQLRESYDKLLRDQRNELLHAWKESSKAWEESYKEQRLMWEESSQEEQRHAWEERLQEGKSRVGGGLQEGASRVDGVPQEGTP